MFCHHMRLVDKKILDYITSSTNKYIEKIVNKHQQQLIPNNKEDIQCNTIIASTAECNNCQNLLRIIPFISMISFFSGYFYKKYN